MSARVVERLAACVALPSPTPPGEVARVADWVAAWAEALGASVTRQYVTTDACNVLASLRFGDGPRLVFNSHMDVVDPSAQDWATPPYEPVIRDGRMTGRGTCDAKGSLVAMLCAMERLAAEPGGLTGEVLLTAVMGEEAGGLGSAHLVAQGLTADAAVVGEPTGLAVARAHKGTYMKRLRFAGRAAHSASPWLGRSAVADAAAFVAASEEETVRLAAAPHEVLGPATMTVTVMSGGALQNTVPDEAALIVDRRLIPGETHDACDRELRAMLDALGRARPGLEVAEPEVVVATVPSETAADEPVVAAALAAAGGEKAAGFNAGCDMSKLVGAGIPTVICGPGSLAHAHRPDESVPLGEVEAAVGVYEGIARRLLHRKG